MFPYARVFEVTHGSVMKETFFQREEQANNKTMWNSSHQERRTKRKFELGIELLTFIFCAPSRIR